MKTTKHIYRPQQATCYILGFTNFIITKNTPTRLVYRHFMTQKTQQLQVKTCSTKFVERNHDTENMHTYWTHEQANGIMDRTKCACIHVSSDPWWWWSRPCCCWCLCRSACCCPRPSPACSSPCPWRPPPRSSPARWPGNRSTREKPWATCCLSSI